MKTLRTLAALAVLASGPLAAAAPAVATTASTAPAPKAASPVAGGDLVSVRLDAGKLSMRMRDATQAARRQAGRDPAEVVLGDGFFAGTVPDRQGFGFLGATGRPVWVLADTDSDFPSWDATGVRRDSLADGAVTVRLRGVEGPGEFHAYPVSSVGAPTLLLGSSEGAPASMALPSGTRRGGALWAFDAPGRYRVTLGAEALLASRERTSTEATYQIDVPATPATSLRALRVPEQATSAAKAGTKAATAPKASAAANTGRKVFADGHIDMGPQLVGDTWTVRIRDDSVSPPAWRDLSDVVVHAVDKAKITVPAGAQYAFLGSAGSQVWLLPQAQKAGIVWPGWNTQDPAVINGTRGNVVWRLKSVTGPGAFKLFLTGSFGEPQVLFDSGKSLPQEMNIPPNTHAHGNWAFTKPGIYRLGVEMTGKTASGRSVSDTRTLNVAVGAVDPNDAFGTGDNNSDSDANKEDEPASGLLPRTGSAWLPPLAGGGVALLLIGGVLVLLARRRRAGRGATT